MIRWFIDIVFQQDYLILLPRVVVNPYTLSMLLGYLTSSQVF
jgi:hypothetical protein